MFNSAQLAILLTVTSICRFTQDNERNTEELIRKLGDPSAEVRDIAERQLAELGEGVEVRLQLTLERTDDVEVRLRGQRILRSVRFGRAFGASLGRRFAYSDPEVKCDLLRRVNPDTFGDLSSKQICDMIAADLLQSPPPSRALVSLLDWVVSSDARWLAPLATSLLRTTSLPPSVRAKSAWTIAETREAPAVLLEYISDQDSTVRAAVVLCACRSDLVTDPGVIIRLLDDASSEVRLSAIRGLQFIQASNSVEAIARKVDDPDCTVQIAALGALRSFRATQFASAAEKQLGNPDSQVRSQAVLSFAVLRGKESLDRVLAYTKDEAGIVRARAVEAVRLLGVGDRLDQLSALLRDPDAGVRAETIAAFTEVRALQYKSDIANLLRDSEASVRFSAAGFFLTNPAAADPAVIKRAIEYETNAVTKRVLQLVLERLEQ